MSLRRAPQERVARILPSRLRSGAGLTPPPTPSRNVPCGAWSLFKANTATTLEALWYFRWRVLLILLLGGLAVVA